MLDPYVSFLIAKKDAKRTLRTPGIYLACIMGFCVIAAGAWILYNVQRAAGLSMSAAYGGLSVLSAAAVYSLYMAVSSVSAVARERQEMTLETLFYGPVSEESFIAGKYLGRMMPYLALAVATVAYIAAIGLAMGAFPGAEVLAYSLSAFLLVSCVVALGIMLSNLTGSVTGSVFMLIAFLLGLFVLKVAGFILGLLPVFNPVHGFLKDLVASLLNATQYVSPIEYLWIGLDAAGGSEPGKYLAAFVLPAAYTYAMLQLSVFILKKKGAGR